MPLGIKGLILNLRPLVRRTFLQHALVGRTFRLPDLTLGLVFVLLLILVGMVVYWDKIPEINWQLLLGRLAIEKPTKETVSPEELEITLPQLVKTYEQTAQPGEGVTHLARRALKSYLEEKGNDFNLTPEHKIFIEDYIQNQTGESWLMLGETLTFSEELIAEAIQKALQLTPDQLENLKQYSALVTGF